MILYVTFCVLLLSASITISGFVHVVAGVSTCLLWPSDSWWNVRTAILLMYSSFDGHLGCFYLLAVMNDATMNRCTQGLV